MTDSHIYGMYASINNHLHRCLSPSIQEAIIRDTGSRHNGSQDILVNKQNLNK